MCVQYVMRMYVCMCVLIRMYVSMCLYIYMHACMYVDTGRFNEVNAIN